MVADETLIPSFPLVPWRADDGAKISRGAVIVADKVAVAVQRKRNSRPVYRSRHLTHHQSNNILQRYVTSLRTIVSQENQSPR